MTDFLKRFDQFIGNYASAPPQSLSDSAGTIRKSVIDPSKKALEHPSYSSEPFPEPETPAEFRIIEALSFIELKEDLHPNIHDSMESVDHREWASKFVHAVLGPEELVPGLKLERSNRYKDIERLMDLYYAVEMWGPELCDPKTGDNVLIRATCDGDLVTVCFLLMQGGDPFRTDKKSGKRAVDYAMSARCPLMRAIYEQNKVLLPPPSHEEFRSVPFSLDVYERL